MLGKQGWKFLSNPDTLVCRVFKSRYFPEGDFLSAPKGYGPSPIWQSIRATQGIVNSGFRWRIGDGACVSVWGSPWIRDDDNLYVNTPRDEDLNGLRVCDLFIPGLREWDVELVHSLFKARDAAKILNIPLRDFTGHDRRIWHYSRKGDYTVRSCYRLIMEKLAPREYLHSPGPWQELWSIAAPPRLRCFAWRIGREVLPTRMALNNRHINVPSECGICSRELENSWHLFLSCPFALRCWRTAGLNTLVETCMQGSESMKEWLFKLVEGSDPTKIAQVIAVMSAIWRERNNRVWNATTSDPLIVVRDGLEGLHNWERAKGRAGVSSDKDSSCSKWHPPPLGKVKCNIDAALFQEEGRWGMGAVLRDASGTLLHYRMNAADGCPNPTECEALALVEAINWLRSLPYNNIVLELDSLSVVQAMESTEDDVSELGEIIAAARRSLPESWLVTFVRRNGNSAAHVVARHSRHLADPIVGDASPPWLINALNTSCYAC
ncbi:Putative ribonuclease H protein At1g65750 [Linum perenne]